MNIQLKKGIVEICILATIKKSPSYGYKIINDLKEVMEISESTLYPILRRLDSSGCLETYSCEFNGRLRKYYRITEIGINKINDFINEWDEMEKILKFIHSREV